MQVKSDCLFHRRTGSETQGTTSPVWIAIENFSCGQSVISKLKLVSTIQECIFLHETYSSTASIVASLPKYPCWRVSPQPWARQESWLALAALTAPLTQYWIQSAQAWRSWLQFCVTSTQMLHASLDLHKLSSFQFLLRRLADNLRSRNYWIPLRFQWTWSCRRICRYNWRKKCGCR